MAFWLVAGAGLNEALWFIATLAFGVGGALCGGLAARDIQPAGTWRPSILFQTVAGLMAGMAGYLWLNWAFLHGNLNL